MGGARGAVEEDGINLIEEEDGRGEFLGETEHGSHSFLRLADVLLDEDVGLDVEEGGSGLLGDGLGGECLPRARFAVEKHSRGTFNDGRGFCAVLDTYLNGVDDVLHDRLQFRVHSYLKKG